MKFRASRKRMPEQMSFGNKNVPQSGGFAHPRVHVRHWSPPKVCTLAGLQFLL